MESYQSIGIVMGILGMVLGLLVIFGLGIEEGLGIWVTTVSLGIWVTTESLVGLILALVNIKHHKTVGTVLIIIGILGNLLLIIPGIMAYRYKPKSESEIKPKSKEEGTP